MCGWAAELTTPMMRKLLRRMRKMERTAWQCAYAQPSLTEPQRGTASVRVGSRAYYDYDDDAGMRLPSSRRDREDMSESKDEIELRRPEQQTRARRHKGRSSGRHGKTGTRDLKRQARLDW